MPDAAEAHFGLGELLREKGLHDEAIACYREAIRLEPDRAETIVRLGLALHENGLLDEARQVLREAAKRLDANAGELNDLAWILATRPDVQFLDHDQVVELAECAVKLRPTEASIWNTLGVAHYRAGNWHEAARALERSVELGREGHSFDAFFLSMANWQLGEQDKARDYYEEAVEWMDKHYPKNDELIRFRAEAAELLGLVTSHAEAG